MDQDRAGAHPAGQDRAASFAGWMGSMWLYTVLRFGLFLALWGVLELLGLRGLVAALIAVVLSVPLSFVLLAAPRARFAAQLEQRVQAHQTRRRDLEERLDPGAPPAQD